LNKEELEIDVGFFIKATLIHHHFLNQKTKQKNFRLMDSSKTGATTPPNLATEDKKPEIELVNSTSLDLESYISNYSGIFFLKIFNFDLLDYSF